MELIRKVEKKYLKEKPPEFKVGDVVDVHVKIKEGDRERVQVFSGTVIKFKGGRGLRAAFTVRRIVQGEGVERVFPLHSPAIKEVRVKRPGRVRRAKLYYLRERVGKSTKVKERAEYEVREAGAAAAKDAPAEKGATRRAAEREMAAKPVEEPVA
jgi:large subunit ribosomal protein L19